MAKTFNNIYTEAKTKVYGSPSNFLTIMALNNTAVEFTPVLAPNGGTDLSATTKYTVQRRKRPSVKAVANANAGTTAAALAVLDSFSKPEWDSLDIATGALKSVGFKKTFKDDYDFSSNPLHAKDMQYQVGEIAVQRHKDILTLLQTATKTGADLPAFAKGDTAVWNAIAAEVDKLAKIEDEFADISALDDFVIITTNEVARELTGEMGTVFNQEAPIAQTGFKSKMNVNGTPTIVDARLAGRECIIMHKNSIGFKSDAVKKDIKVDLGITEFTGVAFFDISAIVDKSRIAKFGTIVKR